MIDGDGTLNEVANGFFESSLTPSTFDFQTSHKLIPISKEAVLGIIQQEQEIF